MHSPIRAILDRVPDSLINIAPERELDTRALLRGVKLCLVEGPLFCFAAFDDRIERPEQGVELVWAASYALWQRYQDYVRHASVDSDSSAGTSLQLSLPLLDWALAAQRRTAERLPWPESLPRPTGFANSSTEPSAERVADEIAMCALGWLLHHELAHISHGDRGAVAAEDSREQESRADRSATEWLLDQAPPGIPTLKRGFGIAVATFCLIALELDHNLRPTILSTHPPAAHRMLASLTHAALDADQHAQLIAAIGLRLLIDTHRIPTKSRDYETPEECLTDYYRAIDARLRGANL